MNSFLEDQMSFSAHFVSLLEFLLLSVHLQGENCHCVFSNVDAHQKRYHSLKTGKGLLLAPKLGPFVFFLLSVAATL